MKVTTGTLCVQRTRWPAVRLKILENSAWRLLDDNRGKTVYDTKTGTPVYISELGPVPDGVAPTGPTSEHQKWNGKAWVTDMVAAKEATLSSFMTEKNRRMSVATHKISLLNDASELGMATEEEKAALTEWKKYRVLLSSVDAEKPDFPVEPA